MGLLAVGIFFTIGLFSPSVSALGPSSSRADYPEKLVTRGEAVARIIDYFDLQKKQRSYLSDCLTHSDECFFVFAAMSSFDGISFDPLQLYPDVTPNSRYYDAINTASILGLVHGYLGDHDTPFRPENVMTRIQALKIVLGGADLMHWKERFEEGALEESIFDDVDAESDGQWWYSRYLNFAVREGIIDATPVFRPDDPVTLQELTEMMERTLAPAPVPVTPVDTQVLL